MHSINTEVHGLPSIPFQSKDQVGNTFVVLGLDTLYGIVSAYKNGSIETSLRVSLERDKQDSVRSPILAFIMKQGYQFFSMYAYNP